ncbi:MAG: DUF6134 family protein [Bacteroidota bacterium]
MYLFFLLLSLFIHTPEFDNTDISYFNIVRNKKTIGELTVVKTRKNGLTTYTSTTHLNVRLLHKVNVFYRVEVDMQHDQLYAASVIIEVNGKVHDRTETTRIEDKYLIEHKGKKKEAAITIDYPEILLLFQEPVGFAASFSEKTGNFHSLHAVGEHAYKKINPKGRENYYYYKDGKLQRAEVDAGLIQFEIVLQR